MYAVNYDSLLTLNMFDAALWEKAKSWSIIMSFIVGYFRSWLIIVSHFTYNMKTVAQVQTVFMKTCSCNVVELSHTNNESASSNREWYAFVKVLVSFYVKLHLCIGNTKLPRSQLVPVTATAVSCLTVIGWAGISLCSVMKFWSIDWNAVPAFVLYKKTMMI